MHAPKWIKRGRVIGVGVIVAALFAITACQPNQNVDYSQWTYPATVMRIGSACEVATAFTYPGHDPSAALAADFMLPESGQTPGGVSCGKLMAATAVSLALQGGWHVHYVAFQQMIWNVQVVDRGWRMMSNRGSWTQNHMDHVHVSMGPEW